MVQSSINQELETLIRARYPIIYVVSWEEERVEEAIRKIAADRGKRVFQWTITQGMVLNPNTRNDQTREPLAALDAIMESRDPAIFLLKDFHSFLNDVTIIRRLRDLTLALKKSFKTIIILAPTLKLPLELEKEITVVEYSLPSLEDLDDLLESIIQSVKANPQVDVALAHEEREHILKAAQGLTANEAENVFAKSLVEKRKFDVDVVLSEKEQIIRKSGILEYYPATEAFSNVGGMDTLKDWMEKRTVAFTEKARAFGLPNPKGVLMLGVQGCGKSLSAKAIASLWRLPLLRMDVGKIFGGIVGQSEENIRKAIRMAESTAPNVVWIDELEKGFSGTQSSGISDGGTTARVFGTFISWLQDKTAPCFVVATANDVSALPPELLRKGRFDEIFFVDLPSEGERREIFLIHLKKRKRDPEKFDLDELAKNTPGFSGAEIEQVVISSLYDAFDENTDITTEALLATARQQVPLSVTMAERISMLRHWAANRARQASSTPAEPVASIYDAAEQLEKAAIHALGDGHEDGGEFDALGASAPVTGETEPETESETEQAA
ncbi:MAG: AAA family ATPase [Capsulimonadaceae bacterium]|nr:AAA family ATPase [Capsulimonadaceae bacterium]